MQKNHLKKREPVAAQIAVSNSIFFDYFVTVSKDANRGTGLNTIVV